LLHGGTDVWLNNAQSLIEEGTIKLEDAICCRDDIMIYLIKEGLPPQKAFKIMEFPNSGTPKLPTSLCICSGVTPNAFVELNIDIVSLSSRVWNKIRKRNACRYKAKDL